MNNLPSIRGSYRFNSDLSKQCWFQVGGVADLIFKPADAEDLSLFLKEMKDIPILVLGVGSNILINDQGFKGCIIRLGRSFNYIRHEGNVLTCGASCLDLNVALYTLQHELGGLEFLAGIPGTIGGAIAMNAGAYGTEIADVLISATAVNKNGIIKNFSTAEIGYHYRGRSLSDEWIFIEAKLQTFPKNTNQISQSITQIQNDRQSSQPIRSKTSGSTFRNPPGYKAWKLIDEAGCRGLQIGGAQVSTMHCNFFINTGTATANDILSLIQEVKERVFKKSGIMLKEEIKII